MSAIELSRFASWIPSVLDEIAALGEQPGGPSDLTIQLAQEEIVNYSGDRSRPTVKAVEALDGAAIEFAWKNRWLTIYHNGRLVSHCH